MARKSQTTTIDEETWKMFKIACIQNDVNMNDVLEELMRMYISGELKVPIPKDK